jgi:23S rRNA (uracil1939-C5)-methyltransferase
VLNKNQCVEAEITDLNNLGFGVAHVDGLTLFVSGAVDGELVRAEVLSVKPTYAVARAKEILRPSPYRIPPACSVRGCGGCAYGAVSYDHEAALKRAYVKHAFRKAGMDVCVEEVTTPNVDGEPLTVRYRNKAQYPVAQDKNGNYLIGFYAAKSHRVLEAASCPLQPTVFGEIVETLRAYFVRYRVPAYREETQEGLIRHIYLRRGDESGEILLTLVLNGTHLPDEDALVATLRARHPALVGILVNTNTRDTNVICGDTWRTLWGRDYLIDTLAGVKLRISPAAFYQVNHAAAELLYAAAGELAQLTGEEQLLDLYCGCGSIGLSMAHRVREVVGVEIEPEAVACARGNARLNGIENARFYCGDAGDARHLLDEAITRLQLAPDIVVLDPPRKGSTAELLSYLAELGIPRIVYISCNPDTLARDAAYLGTLGYTMGAVKPFDLFPRTGHVECVTVLSRNQK